MAEGKGSMFSLLKATVNDFLEDECSVRAASLSYYIIFALPPLLVLLITVAGLVWDAQDVERALTGQFAGVIGPDGAKAIQDMIRNADRPGSGGLVRTLLGVGGLLFGATGAFLQLQGALNRAWEVKPDPEDGGVRRMLTKRLMSLGMVLGIGFLLAVSLALTTAISIFARAFGSGIPAPMLYAVDLGLAFGILTLLFAAMFKILPDAEIEWRDVWVGGAVTAALFVIGKFAIGFYLGSGEKGDAFGAAGALAIVLIWVYYAGIILLFGAEFTQKWALRNGRAVQPEDGAVKIVEEVRYERRRSGGRDAGGGAREPQHAGGGIPPVPRPNPGRRAGDPAYARTSPSTGKGSLLLGAALLLLRLRGRKQQPAR